ncbi:MAG TPA: class II aldolase/adducin family protein [Eubacteriales bacterium]|jgi:ribulose-5-phosphate 4-epimerase/fuculose-1-phosphate aldolase|nr:class II aldolase/adducin family protein [Clostridia bacterium]HRR89996.1 class II aldolase/adducin family protein [Eubacteriales bacterium]HRU84203.1 class II aldolase/adducin family protein [Eubacteriales bacterium]
MFEKKLTAAVEKLSETGINLADAVFAFAWGDRLFITKQGFNLSKTDDKSLIELKRDNIGENELNALSEEGRAAISILKKKKNVGAVIFTAPEYAALAAEGKRSIPPILDDMAQIVGTSLPFAETGREAGKINAFRCCVLTVRGLFATARTTEEAVTATLVAEKSARCYIKAKALGGAKRIPRWHAVLMHIVYKIKYSKKNIERQKEGE